MNYRHSYHAGNFADVVKHGLLVALLIQLQHKETPFCFLDTHAGSGLYALDSEQAQKTKEYEQGVQRLFPIMSDLPDCIARYLTIIKSYNQPDELSYYPGSPLIAAQLLRPQDRMVLCELHPEEKKHLRDCVGTHRQISIHEQDAYLALKAFLPPKQGRGLVLIDPPFESPNEFSAILSSLKQALKCWRFGRYLIWYPIKEKKGAYQFEETLKTYGVPLLIINVNRSPSFLGSKLQACGLALVNPPWQFQAMLESTLLPYLKDSLSLEMSVRAY